MDTFLHLFDHTVKPVLLYGSEIWGTINTVSANVKKEVYYHVKLTCIFTGKYR